MGIPINGTHWISYTAYVDVLLCCLRCRGFLCVVLIIKHILLLEKVNKDNDVTFIFPPCVNTQQSAFASH
jgi:hypothetical protein